MTLRELLNLRATVKQRRDEAAAKVARQEQRLAELDADIEAERADMLKALEE